MSITKASGWKVLYSAKACPVKYEMYGHCADKSPYIYPAPCPQLWQRSPCWAAGAANGPFSDQNPPPRRIPSVLPPPAALSLWDLFSARLTFWTGWWVLKFSPKKLFERVLLLVLWLSVCTLWNLWARKLHWVGPVKGLFAFKETEILTYNLECASVLPSWNLFLQVSAIAPKFPKLICCFGL